MATPVCTRCAVVAMACIFKRRATPSPCGKSFRQKSTASLGLGQPLVGPSKHLIPPLTCVPSVAETGLSAASPPLPCRLTCYVRGMYPWGCVSKSNPALWSIIAENASVCNRTGCRGRDGRPLSGCCRRPAGLQRWWRPQDRPSCRQEGHFEQGEVSEI